MEWYQSQAGARRLEIERKQMEKGAPQFSLYHDTETEELVWRGSVSVQGHSHEIRLVYSENHPYEIMTVYVLKPSLQKHSVHVHDDSSICYMKDEWSPEWTAFSVYLTVLRFLDDYYSGRMYS
jgi:ubiquitin-protein ligase